MFKCPRVALVLFFPHTYILGDHFQSCGFNTTHILMTPKIYIFNPDNSCLPDSYSTASLRSPLGCLSSRHLRYTCQILLFTTSPQPPPKSVQLAISTISINGNSIFPVTQVKILEIISDSLFSDPIFNPSGNLSPSKYADSYYFLHHLQCD